MRKGSTAYNIDSKEDTAIYWAKYCCGNILLNKSSDFTFKMVDHLSNNSCLGELSMPLEPLNALRLTLN